MSKLMRYHHWLSTPLIDALFLVHYRPFYPVKGALKRTCDTVLFVSY